MTIKLCFVLALLIVSSYAELDPITQKLVQTMQSYMNTAVSPCDDFYEYACGSYVRNNPAPNGPAPYAFVSSFSAATQHNDVLLQEIVNAPWPLISELYNSCMQPTDQIVDEIQKTFSQYQQLIEAFMFSSDPDMFYSALGFLIARNTGVFLSISPRQSSEDQQITFASFSPSGAELTAEQYANSSSPLYQRYRAGIIKTFAKFESLEKAEADADYVLDLEAFIADQSAAQSAPQNITIAEFQSQTKINVMLLLQKMQVENWEDDDVILVTNMPYFMYIGGLISDGYVQNNSVSISRYMEWRVMSNLFQSNVTKCWDTETPAPYCYNFMANAPSLNPPWDQPTVCRYVVHTLFKDYIGLIITADTVDADVISSIVNMTLNIQGAFNDSLQTLPWLDDAAIEAVQFKLDNIIQLIGHPNKLERYDELVLLNDRLSYDMFEMFGQITSYILQGVYEPFNRTDFQFDPQVANAFYAPSTNTINFPAGVLDSPVFSATWPKLFQYARLGYVVGHENTHGFDNFGSQFNAYGQHIPIFSSTTQALFSQNAQCIAEYYSNYIQFNTTHVNGAFTLPENIADVGGAKNTYRAYQNWVSANGPEFADYELIANLTTNQAFFLFMGQTWCTSENIEYLESELTTDQHSPSSVRVRGSLSQFDQFAAEFSCPSGSPMNPTTRCNLW